MAQARRHLMRDRPLGWDELDAVERELVSDVVAAICSAKRRHRPDYGTPRTQQLALELT
jgi:hypothetical protein